MHRNVTVPKDGGALGSRDRQRVLLFFQALSIRTNTSATPSTPKILILPLTFLDFDRAGFRHLSIIAMYQGLAA